MATATTQYWLFQAHPKVFRLKDALRYGALNTFPVKAHKDKIQEGDFVILWQAGKNAGCYGLATVLSKLEDGKISEQEFPFYQQPIEESPRVSLKMEYNLWNKPITKELLPEIPSFDNFYAGIPGTTFKASMQQYKALESLVHQLDLVHEPEPTYPLARERKFPLNLILYGPPGTGKTYQTVNLALAIIEDRSLEEIALEDRQVLRNRFLKYQNEGQLAFVTFHQSFGYEDFVEGIKPAVQEDHLKYRVEAGIFKQLCVLARQAMEEICQTHNLDFQSNNLPVLPDYILDACPKYVLVIDEINRGNIPGIFGELITLIETEKRAGAVEGLQLILPYSKSTFSVPINLHIIGTMNTADRSTEVIDYALRRRFAFKSLDADPGILSKRGQPPMVAGIDLVRLLQVINHRIELLLDRDHLIGPSYFLGIANLDDLKYAFSNHVIPLLQEYFFNDYRKIGLVLGRDFVQPINTILNDQKRLFADFDHPFTGEFEDKTNYYLIEMDGLDEKAFIHIYDPEFQ